MHRRLRRGGDPLEVLGVVGSVFVVIALREIGGQVSGKGLGRRAVLHAKRFEDVVGDILLVGLARNPFDDVAGKRRAVVGIRKVLSRRVNALGHIPDQELAQRQDVLLILG